MVTIDAHIPRPMTAHVKVSAKSKSRLLVQHMLLLLTFVLLYYPFDLKRVDAATPRTPRHNYGNLPNFRAVHTYLLRGGAPTTLGLDELKNMGVKTIIDLRRNKGSIDVERIQAQERGMFYESIPMGDFVPSFRKQKRFFNILSQARDNPSKSPVFLHCSHGSDRTSFLVALWRVRNDHWTIAQAAVEMLQSGFIIHKFRKDERPQQMFE